MAKAKCVLCGKPARRICPLEGKRPLCALCCRKKVEIPHPKCPVDCPFFTETITYLETKWLEILSQLVRQVPEYFFKDFSENTLTGFNILLRAIHNCLMQGNYQDIDLLNALEALRYELKAARSRLIYDATPLGGPSQTLFWALRDYLQLSAEKSDNKLQKPKEFILDKYPRESVEEVFEILKRLIKRHQSPDGAGFVKFFISLTK
ncbi:MAG: hypothetical protein N2246_03465 [Candidatus Sumerlaeia bacterium]|nr:hypothetical protein [Candidatus Sumerlaeia bacterium]